MKLWAGRFQKETDTLVNDFNSSIQFDARLYKQDIAGSIAHAQMLGKQGIIEEHEVEAIVDGLKAILEDIEADKVEFSVDNEDIHMNIETLLTQRIGDAGKRLHTARSRKFLLSSGRSWIWSRCWWRRPRSTPIPLCPAIPTCSVLSLPPSATT